MPGLMLKKAVLATVVALFSFAAIAKSDTPYDIAGLCLGKTTQTDLAKIWHTVPKVEVGVHPHSGRSWSYKSAQIDSDGIRYKGRVVIVTRVQFSEWKGDLARFLTGTRFPKWLRSLHVGDPLSKIPSKMLKTGQTRQVLLSTQLAVSLDFNDRGLYSLTCSNPRAEG